MATLHEVKVWKKSDAHKVSRSDLTSEEQANVRRALHFLRRRHGGYQALATALKVKRATLERYGSVRMPSIAIALRLARLAGVALEDVLNGHFPAPGACPFCGRVQ
jgi:hypothetical protein